jgi:hypothetical protein
MLIDVSEEIREVLKFFYLVWDGPIRLEEDNLLYEEEELVKTHTDKWLDCDLQRTDPASRQRRRSTEIGHQIPDSNSWEGNNIWSNVHKVGLIPRYADWLSAVKWLWLSRQRGRRTETRQQIPDPNSWEGSNIWSNVHKVGSTPRHADWPTVSRKVTLTLTDWPLVREGAPQRQDNKFQTQTLEKEAISGQTSTKSAWYQDILTDWLSVVK